MALPRSKSFSGGGDGSKKSKRDSPRSSSGSEDNVYEVEKIVGMTKVEGETFYRVRWLGFSTQDDTLEPYENLASCKDLIEEFLERQKKKKRKAANAAHKPIRKKSSSQAVPDPVESISHAVSSQNVDHIETAFTKELTLSDNSCPGSIVESPQFILDLLNASTKTTNAQMHHKPKSKAKGNNAAPNIKKPSNKPKRGIGVELSISADSNPVVPSTKPSVKLAVPYLTPTTDQNNDSELIGEPRVDRTSVLETAPTYCQYKSNTLDGPLPLTYVKQSALLGQSSQRPIPKSASHHCQKGLTSPQRLTQPSPASTALSQELSGKKQKLVASLSGVTRHRSTELQDHYVGNSKAKDVPKESLKGNDADGSKGVTSEMLHNAVIENDHKRIKEFIDGHKGCELEYPSNNGTTLLMRAAFLGHHTIAELLVLNGADINAKSRNGTALNMAAGKGWFYVVSVLLELGAHMDVRATSTGTTPLIEAVTYGTRRGDVQVIRKLLEYGANFAIKDSQQLTALEHAKNSRFSSAERMLSAHIKRVTSAFEVKVNATISNTAQLVCPLFPLHCFALNEDTSFVICFDHKLEQCPPAKGVGMLLFIAHALIKGDADVKCRFHGPCAVNSVYLNGKLQTPLTEDGKYIFSFCPLKDGSNKLEIKTVQLVTTEVKLLVCAYKTKLCTAD